MKKWFILISLTALISLACLSGKGQDLDSAIANLVGGDSGTDAPESSSPKVVLKDNFDDAYSGWSTVNTDEGEAGYDNGVYLIRATQSGNAVWGFSGNNLSNVSIEVTAKQVSSPSNNNNDYGVMCRMTGSGGYSFNISGDGYYSIQIIKDGIFSDLVRWTRSTKIHTGNSSNKIKVICNGSTLSFYVNGKKLVQTTDSSFSSGDIAFAVTTYESEASEVHFDNLVVKTP